MPPTLRPRKRPETALSSSQTSNAVTTSASTSTGIPSSSPIPDAKRRVTQKSGQFEKQPDEMSLPDEERPLLHNPGLEQVEAAPGSLSWAKRNQWVVFALASGACAAFNGVFAKLTTTELTASFSSAISQILGLEHIESVVEVIVRGTFFGLNLVFNGVMWTLFTTALARGNSTTQVSIMNTSSNFVITAILGLVIFSESLPPMWWLGAAMLVAGNVIIGRKDEGEKKESEVLVSEPRQGDGEDQREGVKDEDEDEDEDEDVADLRL